MNRVFSFSQFKYLQLSIDRLRKHIPFEEHDLLDYYSLYDRFLYEEIGEYKYCLFTWPELNNEEVLSLTNLYLAERIVLLVYDNQDRIIADISAIHSNMHDFLASQKLFEHLCDDSDWSYLEHYSLIGSYFPEYQYPPCESEKQIEPIEGETILFTNAYVTITFRRQHIFKTMTELVDEYVLKQLNCDRITLYKVFAMDPDVACYGPDSKDEPYIYSFEKDEPDRLRNAEIAKRLGYETIYLEELEENPDSDGTKRWFCIKRENILFVEQEYIN